MNIAIYGTGFLAERFFRHLMLYNAKVVYFIQTVPDKDRFMGIKVVSPDDIDCKDFDYLIIAVYDGEKYDEILKKIESYDSEILLGKTKHILEWFAIADKNDDLEMPFFSLTTNEELTFLTEIKDTTIPEFMWYSGRIWSKNEMESFLELSKIYYEQKIGEIFLDIGANIGTTSIYMRKKELKVIGFEPGKSNYKLFRVNCILNDADDITTENIALGDRNGEVYFYYNQTNSGGSGISSKKVSSEKAALRTLDDYCRNNNISAEDVGYIWIDVEGGEADVIHGALSLLKKKRIPLWQEFNPVIYKKAGKWERYLDDITALYQGFINYAEFKKSGLIVHDISELESLSIMIENNEICQTDLFFF